MRDSRTCLHCEHWRIRGTSIGRCAQKIRDALSKDPLVPIGAIDQWTNPNDTCEQWAPRER